MNKIKVIAAIVDTTKLTLYKDNGDTVVIMQGDPRVARIIREVQPHLTHPGASYEIDLDEGKIAKTITGGGEEMSNEFSKFEEKSGIAKFFKVAKRAIKNWFSHDDNPEPSKPAEPVDPISLGSVETFTATNENYALEGERTLPVHNAVNTDLNSAIDEVMANAIPASAPDFALTRQEEDTHDIVAVVTQDDGTKQVIPNAHNLAKQVVHANETGNVEGINALMKRMAAVAGSRTHSVEDLLKFIKRADLPITNDGRILFYKMLNKAEKNTHTLPFVDVHSGKVFQGPGCHVFMDIKLVDPMRSNECSSGLHVARRSYLGSFHGEVCMIGSLAPEDVVAVPNRDANKMRVMAYDLHYVLTDEEYSMVKRNEPVSPDMDLAKKVAAVIEGKQPPIHTTVEIGGPSGTNLTIVRTGEQPVEEALGSDAPVEVDVAPVASIEKEIETEVKVVSVKDQMTAPMVDPTKVAKTEVEKPTKAKVTAAPKAESSKPATPREQIAALLAQPLNAVNAALIDGIKRKAKKSYSALGVNWNTEQAIKALLSNNK